MGGRSMENTRFHQKVAPEGHAGNQRFGDYELLEEIARGGMGVVFKARQVKLDRIVAVKMILFGQFARPDSKQRFWLEARAAATLHHPNLVTVHEVGEHDGFPFYSMDYIEGESLAQLVRDKPLAPREAARHCRIIAEAIQHAHERGVIHRDLKPSNVIVDAQGNPHIADFGLAKLESSNADLTVTGQVMGTPQYLSPEQARGQTGSVGPASDVYAIGAILYHLLTGRPPFLAQTVQEILSQVVAAEPVSPRLLVPNIPADLETICLKCLEKEPQRRFGSARDLAEDLARYLAGRPILAKPAGRIGKIQRWCRREPKVATLSAAILVLVLAAATLVTSEWRQAESERVRAEERGSRLRRIAYGTAIKSAFAEYANGSVEEAVALLLAQKPAKNETDLRGFEWGCLWRLCHPETGLRLPARTQVLGAMTFSPDSKLLAGYYWNNILRFWNPSQPERELLCLTNIASLGGFCANRQLYAAGTRSGTILFLDPRAGQIVRSVPDVGELLAVSSMGDTGVTLDPDGTLRVRDLATLKIKASVSRKVFRRSDYNWAAPVALSADGQFLAIAESGNGTLDPGICVWDIAGDKALHYLPDHRLNLCLAFSPLDTTLAAGGGDGRVILWNVRTAEPKILEASAGLRGTQRDSLPVCALAFTADGKTLAAGGFNERIELWDVSTGQYRSGPAAGPVGVIWSLAFSPDGDWLANGSRNSGVPLWDLKASAAPDSLEGIASNLWGQLCFSPDSRLLAVAFSNNIVRVYDSKSLRLIRQTENACHVVGFSADSNRLLVFTDKVAQWWNISTDTVSLMGDFSDTLNGVTAVDLSPDRTRVAFGYEDGTIHLVDILSGRELSRWQTASPAALAMLPEGSHAVLSLAFSPRGDKLVSGGRDRSMTVWDLTTRRRLMVPPGDEHRGAVCALAFSPNETWIASGCGAATIKLWKAANLAQSSSFSYHRGAILSLDFCPNNQTLISGSQDGTVKFLSVDDPGLEIGSLEMDSPVARVLFSPDGMTLAVVTADGRLKLLRAALRAEVDAMAATE